MSELQFYLRPRPAYEPIEVKGNWFLRDGERFFIKGINYFRRQAPDGRKAKLFVPLIDPFASESLHILQRDLGLFRTLGLNTVLVLGLDPSNSHDEALNLLAEAGMYVVVKLSLPLDNQNPITPTSDLEEFYTLESVTQLLRLVDELADYPNILGFVVSGSPVHTVPSTKFAQVLRAGIRDIKTFLRLRGGRHVPCGVTCQAGIRNLRIPTLQYFTAGPAADDSRVDFFAPGSYSWAHKSSFQISGWKNMVKLFQDFPVPMFLSEFGSYVGKERIWEEIECLYSPDMTGLFSGGCVYTYYGYNTYYGLVESGDDGHLVKKNEFTTLERRLELVGRRRRANLYTTEAPKDYQSWTGTFPEVKTEGRWHATQNLPDFPGQWDDFIKQMEQQRPGASCADDALTVLPFRPK